MAPEFSAAVSVGAAWVSIVVELPAEVLTVPPSSVLVEVLEDVDDDEDVSLVELTAVVSSGFPLLAGLDWEEAVPDVSDDAAEDAVLELPEEPDLEDSTSGPVGAAVACV